MRKTTIFTLILCICLLWSFPVGAAEYSDIGNHWAEQDIARLSARGLVSGEAGGQFAPEQTITRQEAIAMLVRMGGQGTTVPASGVAAVSKGVSPWAVNYLEQALQKGIINENELRASDWSAPATRAEMAVWLSKTLQLTPVVNDSEGIMNTFQDRAYVYSYQAPYIIPLIKNGVMVGSNGYLRPLSSLKRSEAAVLINRADIKFPQPGGNKAERGQVVSVDSSYHIAVMLKDASGLQRSRVITQQTGLYSNGRKISYKNLAKGQWLNYIVNGSQLLYAEVAGTVQSYVPAPVVPATVSVIGELEELNTAAGLVRIYAGGTQLSYRTQPFLSVYTNAKAGDEVALTVQNGWVSSITAVTIDKAGTNNTSSNNSSSSSDYTIYKATLKEVNSDDEIYLTSVYKLEDGRWRSSSSMHMEVERNADIYYDGDEIDLEDLEDDYEGDTAYVAYDEDNDEAVTIRVKKGSEYNYDDVVDRVNSRSLELDDNDEVYCDDDVIVIEDGKLRDWEDVEKGDDVFVTVNYTGGRYYAAVIELLDDSDSSSSDDLVVYRGYLSDVDEAGKEIKLRSVYYLGSSDWRSRSDLWIDVPRNTEIYYDNDAIDLEDLEDDHDGETIYVAYDEDEEEALQIRVRDGSEYVWSDVVERTWSGSFELEDEEQRVYYDDSTIVIHDNRLVNGSYIDEDDDVLVVVERNGSTYRAAIVIID